MFWLVTLTVLSAKVLAQGVFVNRVYEDNYGNPVFNPILNPFGIQWSQSIANSNGDIITVGHTYVTGQGENIFLRKLDADGNVIFSSTWNSTGSQNDYGVNLYVASNGEIFVCGTTDNGGTTNYDAVVLRYSSAGSLINATTWAGGDGKNDIGTALIIHPTTNNLLVAITNENNTTGFDYCVVQLNPTSLSPIGSPGIYDYTNLIEVALGIEIDTGTGNVLLIGGSQSSAITCAYAVAIFDGTTLSYISDSRTDLVGTPYDQALSYVKDNSNNLYITGKTLSGTTFNMKTVKINANYSIAWTRTVDVHGFDDIGNTIALDPTNGNVLVGGYATKTNNVKEMYHWRLNGSNGNIINSDFQAGEDNSGDAIIKKLCTNVSGDVYFIGGEKGKSGFNQVVVGKIRANGKKSWQRKVSDNTKDILPSDIDVTTDGVFIISVVDAAADSYLTDHYEEMELDTAKLNYGQIKYKDGELIVRFKPSALNTSAINNSRKEFGSLSDFLTSTANSAVLAAFDEFNICSGVECNVKAIKIFPTLQAGDTTEISHLNETIDVPDLWTAMLLQFPPNYGVLTVGGVFNNNLTSVAHYAEPNFLAKFLATPNDSLYSQQYSIRNNTVYPNAHVNAEEAWDVIHSGGRSFVRAGIYDTPMGWDHRDFNYDGTNPSSSKVIDGYNFTFGVPLKSLTNSADWHGTSVGGIIGAQRNNVSGIAGIAGGNDSIGSKGVSIYNLAIMDPGGSPTISPVIVPLSYIANAIVAGAQAPGTNTVYPYCYGVHFQNHSWGLETPSIDPGFVNQSITLFKEAIHKINRMKVTAIGARGNSYFTPLTYPANCDDDWIICTTGTGTNGAFAHDTAAIAGPFNCEFTSAWGGDVDVAAPASGSLITTTWELVTGGSQWQSFGGTSAAAPHVSGAVGLMMSYLNDTTGGPNYRNMAPEDCEAILQLTATDTDSTGYDRLTGFGRLNVGKALRKIQKPYHDLLHFGTNNLSPYTVSKAQSGSTVTANLIERFEHAIAPYPFYQAGVYNIKPYRITSTVNHAISSQDTIIAYWPRPSSSVTWNLYSTVSGTNYLTPRQKTKILSLNQTQAVLEGWVYEVKVGNTPIGWWPVDTAYIQGNPGNWAEYSVLVRNYTQGTHTAIKKETLSNREISVYPNPTSGSQSLEIYTDRICDITIDIYDIMGRKVKTVYSGKTETSRTLVTHDVSNLPNSLYIYNINIDGKTTTKKFIKQ